VSGREQVPYPQSDPPRQYSEIYEKLVKNDDQDLVGMVAYALYKQSKREWLMQYEQSHGATPSPEEERVFVSAYTRHELDRLREQAKSMLSAYANYVIDQAAPEIRERAQEEYLINRVDTTLGRIVVQNR
jgi:hypothetical protein